MSLHSMNALLAEALACANLPPAALNSAGAGEITVHGLAVGLEYTEKDERLVLYCSVGRLPAEVSSDIYEFLLETDLFGAKLGGGHLGLYAPSRTLLFSLGLETETLTAARLANAFSRFAEQAVTLIKDMEEHLAARAGSVDVTLFTANMLWV